MNNSESKNKSSLLLKNLIIIFCISILVFSTSYIYSISKLNNNISNGINYTIKVDENLLYKNGNLTDKDIESFEKNIQTALEKSSSDLVLENANNAINNVSVTIAVSSIFFTVLVVIISLFQFIQAKDYEKKYEEYTNKMDSLEKNFQNKLDEYFNKLDEKTNELSSIIIDYNKIIFSYNNANLLFESANYSSSLENLKETVSSIKSFSNKKITYIDDIFFSRLKEINMESHRLIIRICSNDEFELIDSDLALKSCQALIDSDPYDYDNYFYAAYIHTLFNFNNVHYNQDLALSYYLSALNMAYSKNNESDIAKCHYNIALFYSEYNDRDNALEYYTKAIKFDDSNDEYFFSRAQCYEKSSNGYNDAFEDYTKAIELNNSNADYFFHRAWLYEKQGVFKEYSTVFEKQSNFRKALDDYAEAIKIDDTNDEYFFSRAQCYERINEFDLALSDYHKSIELDDEYNSKYYLKRAELYEKLNKPDLALFDYETAINFNPNNYNYYYYCAKFYEKQNKFNLALNYYLKSIDIITFSDNLNFSSYEDVYLNLALFYIGQNEFDSALSIYNQLDKKFGEPSNLNFKYYSILASIYENKKNFEEALVNYKKTLKIVKFIKGRNFKSESKRLKSKIEYCKSKLK